MKQRIKSLLYYWDFTHKLTDLTWNIFQYAGFFIRWKILNRRKKLNMRHLENFRNGLQDLIADLPDNITMIEIGSYRGESAEIFLASGKVSKIFCIDPWKPFYDKSDAASYTNMAKVEKEFDERFANDSRVTKEKGIIDDFITRHKQIPSIDFVYIDGCHTEEATLHDILLTQKHINPTFAIAGHDYVMPGVTNAVNSTFGEPDKIYIDTSWIKFLK